MASIPKLAIFDIDGTISEHGNVVPEAIKGVQYLQQQGCLTTVSTGRSYVRLKGWFGELFETLISQDALLIVEHGTRVVTHDGKTLLGEYFNDQEIQHIYEFIRANIGICKYVRLNPDNPADTIKIYCVDQRDLQAMEQRENYAQVVTAPIAQLIHVMLEQRFTNITVQLKDHVNVHNLRLALTRSETHIIFQDGFMEFVKNNINKGLAVLYAADKLNVDLDDILIAGNAINDVEMLDLGAAQSILVGPEDERKTVLSYLSNPQAMITVDSPTALGNYLQKLI